MLNNGDKLIVTKTVAPFLKEGDIVEVTNVTDDGIISFAFGDNMMHMGVMNTAECEAHFEKVVEEEAPTVTQEYIDEIIENSTFDVKTVFDKCTIVTCKLPNGFVIVESSACVSPENYDEEIGMEICLKKIKDKVWELEGYMLQQYLWEEELDEHPCCCDNCEEPFCDCEVDCDECWTTDIDCNECEDYECDFNPNR